MTIDKFMGLYNILKSDMYGIACSLATYAKCGPYGTNVYRPTGLGVSPNQQRSDSGWNNQNSYKGFGANSFLNNASKKGDWFLYEILCIHIKYGLEFAVHY